MEVSLNDPECLDLRTVRRPALVAFSYVVVVAATIFAFVGLGVLVDGLSWYVAVGVSAFLFWVLWSATGDLDRTRVILDRKTGSVSILQDCPFRKPLELRADLSRIVRVRVRSFEADDVVMHEPLLCLENGAEWPLYRTRHASIAEKMTHTINDWLGEKP